MKRFIATFILVFIIGSLLVGCMERIPNDDANQAVTGDDDSEKEKESESQPNENPDPETTPETNPEITPEPTPDPNLKVGTAIGDLMKSVELERIDGEGKVSIEDHKGKIIIFNIWATWCPPCVSELPHFDEFASDYADDVVIIAAHTAYNNYGAFNYVSSNFSDSSIIFAYDTPSDDAYAAAGGDGYVPYTVILDKNGAIVYSGSGPLSYTELKQMVDPLK